MEPTIDNSMRWWDMINTAGLPGLVILLWVFLKKSAPVMMEWFKRYVVGLEKQNDLMEELAMTIKGCPYNEASKRISQVAPARADGKE